MVGVSEWGLKTCQKVQEGYNDESWTPLKRYFKNPNMQTKEGAQTENEKDKEDM